MSDFKKGDFIEWTLTVGGETVSYTGLVLSFNGVSISYETDIGVLNIMLDDGRFKKVSKPKNWDEKRATAAKATAEMHKKAAAKPAAPKKAKTTERKARAPKAGGTKIDQIVELLKARPELITRKDAINAIVAAGISTTAGASTFYNTAKKML